MILSPKDTHPMGENSSPSANAYPAPISLDTYDGKVHIEWSPDSPVTPLGQLPFFIQFLKLGGRFDPWVNACPLHYASNNAPEKIDVLGSLFLSILSGHKRYAHITTLMSDRVNPQLLGMNKIISEDSARRAIKKIDEEAGVQWLKKHLLSCCEPLLNTPWILDADTTVKPIYGHQEAAEKGYNPEKPGRPSHTYHTYMIANLRLILETEVKAGNQSHSNYSLPGLMTLLTELNPAQRPYCVRGDMGWGTDSAMTELENINQHFLFKLRKSPKVVQLIHQHHIRGEWINLQSGWQAKEAQVTLQGWEKSRRAIIVRRQLKQDAIIGLERVQEGHPQMTLLDGPEDIKAFEYSVLITSLEADLITLFQLYRDRADCENNFDELKNQWGWGGYTTQDVKSCRLMARIIAFIYNWWNLYTRLALPGKHHEAITSRPLLLSSIGRLTTHGGQKTLSLTSMHNELPKLKMACERLMALFIELKHAAPQLKPKEPWRWLMGKIIETFIPNKSGDGVGQAPILEFSGG
jgi:hypothetical protein